MNSQHPYSNGHNWGVVTPSFSGTTFDHALSLDLENAATSHAQPARPLAFLQILGANGHELKDTFLLLDPEPSRTKTQWIGLLWQIYRKTQYFMAKSMVSRFPVKIRPTKPIR